MIYDKILVSQSRGQKSNLPKQKVNLEGRIKS